MKIGTQTAATWKDDVSKTCKAALELDGKAFSSGTKVSEPGTLKLTVTDEAGNASSAEIKLTKEDSTAPAISIAIPTKNVIAGVTVTVKDNKLLFNEDVAASWTDDYTETCDVQLTLVSGEGTEKTVNSGETLSEAGTLKVTVTDEFKNAATAEIALTAVAVYGLKNLSKLQLVVDESVDLLQGLTFAEGITLQKVEIVQDEVRTVIVNPNAFTPEYPGSIDIVLTLAKPDGSTLETTVNNLTIKPLDYHPVTLETADIIENRFSWFNKP